jgi:hypothetical protein
MNRFRKMGFVEYNGRIRVHKSLLNVVLHDHLPEHNAKRPPILTPGKATQCRPGKGRQRVPGRPEQNQTVSELGG